ncbi:MAG: glycosyl hydrolase [Halioglobus sp.]
MLRSVLKIGGITLAVLLVLAATLTGWTLHRLQAHLEPPPNPPGQPSIASYANAATPAADIEPGSPLSGTLAGFDWSRIDDPPIAARPWTRWWWPGGDINAQTARAQLDVLRAAGFGGVEIQPFLGGMINMTNNDEVMARVYAFDTPSYYETLDQTLEHAAEIGLQVDLTHFSGWPPGGPEVLLEDSNTILAYGKPA